MPKQTFGIVYETLNEENTMCEVRVVGNYSIKSEYKIVLLDDEGNEVEEIQDFSDNNIVMKREGTSNRFKVTVREIGSGEICEEEVIGL